MIALVLKWVMGTWLGRVAAGLVVGFVALQINNAVQRSKGAATVIEASKEQGKANAEKSRKAHEKARQPGAADRLLRDSCRDC